jgi:hypothetical protein
MAKREDIRLILPGTKIALDSGVPMCLESIGRRMSRSSDALFETYVAAEKLPPRKKKRLNPAAYERWARVIGETMDDESLEAFHAMLVSDSHVQFFHFIGRELRARRKPGP